MSILLPEFKDHRVCCFCGAPAAIIGVAWNRDGVDDWWAKPIESPVPEDLRNPRHVQTRTKRKTFGRTVETETYRVQVFTHVCTRIPGRTAAGTITDDHRLSYTCGVLMVEDTKVVAAGTLPSSCFYAPQDGGTPAAAEVA